MKKQPTAFIVVLMERLGKLMAGMKLPGAAKKPMAMMQNTGKAMGRGMVQAGSAMKRSGSWLYRMAAKNKIRIGVLLVVGMLTWMTADWYHSRRPLPEAPRVTQGPSLDTSGGAGAEDAVIQADPGANKPEAPVSPAAGTPEEPSAAEQEARAVAAQVDVSAMVRPVEGTPGRGYGFGYSPAYNDYRLHPGVNIAAPVGTPVTAALPGKVEAVEFNEFYRYRVTLDHGGGWQTVYINLDKVKVSKGQEVAAGAVLASVGEPGKAAAEEGSHLHFQLRKDSKAVDPAPYLGLEFKTSPR
ncbi:MAG: peptidoglycan DD-metalloendopeptidase family protein [Bacillota bacterium]